MKKFIKILNRSKYIFYTLPFFSDPLTSIHFQKKLKNHHFIFLDPNPLFKKLRQAGHSVFCLKELDPSTKIPKNSAALLGHSLTQKFIQKTKGTKTPAILYFKPQAKIEKIIQKNNWKAINNPASLQRELENKFNFQKICQQLEVPHPQTLISTLNPQTLKKLFKDLSSKLVVQSAHGWAGNTTFLVDKKTFLKKHLLLNQKVKISPYIPGLTLINNAVTTKHGTLQSPPALQFTGLPGLTHTPLGTCGRQWPAPISKQVKDQIVDITQKIGDYLYQKNYKGFFGLDFQLSSDQKLYLIEINPRLTASFSFYTHLEMRQKITPLLVFHVLEHLNLLYKINLEKEETRTFNQKIVGSELSQKLNHSEQQLILKAPPSGIYTINTTKPTSLKPNWPKNLEITKKRQSYLVVSKHSKETVSPNSEYLKITKLDTFYDPKTQKIKPLPLKLNQSLNEKFQFQKS